MVRSMLIWLVVTAVVLFKTNQRDAGKHNGLKAVHSLFVVFLVLTHSTAFRMLGWIVGHPERIMEHFYVHKDLFAPWASLTVWALNTILSLAAIVLGFALARRVPLARRAVLWMIPFLCLIDWLEAFKGAMAEPRGAATYLLIATAISLLTVIPYALMYIFYGRDSVASALFGARGDQISNQAVEATS